MKQAGKSDNEIVEEIDEISANMDEFVSEADVDAALDEMGIS